MCPACVLLGHVSHAPTGGGDCAQEFRKTLIGLTDVTRQFFDKLVAQLEKGLGSLAAEYDGSAAVALAGVSGGVQEPATGGEGSSRAQEATETAGGGGGSSSAASGAPAAPRGKRGRNAVTAGTLTHLMCSSSPLTSSI